jgi:sodium-dependent dicarboxylate transporter 2/3/5
MVPTQKSGQERLLVEDDIRHVSLPILLLFGGGLALSAGFQESGLSQWLGSHLSVSGTEMIWVSFLSLSGVSVFLTELMSNTALASILVPIVGSLSSEPELVRVLVLLVAFSASLSFMLPMATPPNAIVFSKARMPMKEMMWIGFGLNLLFILFLSAVFALYASLFVV